MNEEQIKANLKAAGLDEGLASQVRATTQVELDAAVAALKADAAQKPLTKEQLLVAVHEAGLDAVLKEYVLAAENRRVAEVRTEFEKKFAEAKVASEKSGVSTSGASQSNGDQTNLTPEQKAYAALQKQIEDLTKIVQGVTTETAAQKHATAVRAELAKAKLPEGLAKYVTKDVALEAIPDAVKALGEDLQASTQAAINARLEAGDLSMLPKGTAAGTLAMQVVEQAADAVNRKQAGTDTGAPPGKLTLEAAEAAKKG